jgi:competence protein ComEC
MLRVAALAVLLSCVVSFAPSLPGALECPEVLAVAAAVVWVGFGPVAGVAVATTAWTTLSLGWALDQRLAPQLAGRDIIVTGAICDFPRDHGRARRFTLHVDSGVGDPPLPARIYFASYGVLPNDAGPGQRWRLKLRLKRPRGTSNPGGFDFERWTLTRRLGATGYVRRSAINRRIGSGADRCPMMPVRQFLADEIDRAVAGSDAARFLPALAVGARHRLTPADWRVLRRTGLVHLMAISGLHIGMVAALLFAVGRGAAAVLNRIGIDCPSLAMARLLAIAGATVYAALAGFAVPTTRALVMVGIGVALATSRRPLGGFRILGIGFWLSFGAVAILLLDGLAVDVRDVPFARLRSLVRAQMLLGIGLAPLALRFFGELSLVAPLANFVLVPIFTLLFVPVTLLGTALLPILPAASTAVFSALAVAFDWGFRGLIAIASWSGAALEGVMPAGTWLLAVGAGIVLLLWPRPMPMRWCGAVPLLAVALGAAQPRAPPLRVVVLDVGQGLAVIVQTRDHALLFDAGPAYGDRDAAQSVVLPALEHLGIDKLDVLVVSHGDNDHVGGAQSILESFPRAALISTAAFRLSPRRMVECTNGLAWRWNGIRFRVLHPGNDAARFGENDRSCVLSVSGPEGSVLLPGDIERRAEMYLVRSRMLRPHDIVIAPHHGSRTSSSAPFAAALAPRIVVFSAAFANRWGFPADAVRSRWVRVGACPLQTALRGALIFESSGEDGLRLVASHRAEARRRWTEGPIPHAACESHGPVN